jgi:protein required for attachment to host cells
MGIWIVVADSAKARFFAADQRNAKLVEVDALEHQEGRLHERELTSDLPGRDSNGSGGARHAMSSQVGPKKQEAIKFAKQVADYLEAGRVANRFKSLHLMASPTFLGHVRDHLSGALSQLVASSTAKNVVDEKPEVIRSHLPDYL